MHGRVELFVGATTLIYYKWLTLDMSSHRDHRCKWPVGRALSVEEYDAPEVGAMGRGLHLLKRPEDALRFGRWPGRLFEAEPVGAIVAEDQEKVRCSGVRLITELDSAQVFGPMGRSVVGFISQLKHISWLKAEGSLEVAMEAVREHQVRLASWGWGPLPLETRSFDDWGVAADLVCEAVNPGVSTGAWTAWSTNGSAWAMCATQWAAWAAWGAAWSSVEPSIGASAWSVARESWTGKAPWPSPNDADWVETARSVRSATRSVAVAAASDAARTAEYLVSAGNLPQDPFEPLMKVWQLGYWPMGVIDGRYIIADLSSVSRRGGT